MLIPTFVGAGSTVTLAVPDTSYWCSTAAHFYINPPGTSITDGCVWCDQSKPFGNWAPFVTGANKASDGNTYVTAGINPIYCCEPSNGYSNRDPGFGIRIECPDGGCNGLPCECNPSTMGVNKCTGGSVGAGGAEFCVVTVPQGGKANIVVFSTSSNQSLSTSPLSSTPNLLSSSSSPPPPSPSHSSSSTLSTSILSTSYGNATVYHRPTPSQSQEEQIITIYPTGVGLTYNLGYPQQNNATTSVSAPAVAIQSATPSPSQSTSGTDRLSRPSTGLSTIVLLMAIVALGMFNL